MKREIYKLLSSAKKGLFALALVASGTAHSQLTYSFAYTGAVQTLTLPAGSWGIECWAANGGSINTIGGQGKGGYSQGAYNVVTNGTQLNIFVGGRGNQGSGNSSTAGAGGWNGGGGGAAVGYSGGGGGGATDVRVGGTSAGNRVIVAGGGGGAAYYGSSLVSSSVAPGGNGGAQVGQNGSIIISSGLVTPGGGGAGANGGSPGLATVGTANGDANGGGGGGSSAGASIGQPGTGGGAGGLQGPSGSGSTGSAGGGGGGYAGGAGGVQTSNGGLAGGGGSGYLGGVTSGTTVQDAQPGFVANPDVTGHGYVIITRLCDLQITASKNPICVGETITLNSNAGSNIVWSTGANTATITVTPTTTTGYTMSGVSSSTAACSSTISIIVNVNPLPIISTVSFPSVMCAGGSGTIAATGAASYTWSTGTTGGYAQVSPTVSSVYTATGTSSEGCKNTATVMVNVSTNSLTVSQNTTVCKGNSTTLSTTGAIGVSWSNGSSFPSIPVSPLVTTVYSVSGQDNLGCTLSNTVSVTVLNLPTVSVSASALTVCKGESVTLTASGANTYSWSTGDTGPTSTQKLPVDLSQNYTVTGTDNNGCQNTAQITISVLKCTGLEEQSMGVLALYPNPGSGVYTIKREIVSPIQVKVFNSLGVLISSHSSDAANFTFDISTQPAGIYFVEITGQENHQEIYKVIRN